MYRTNLQFQEIFQLRQKSSDPLIYETVELPPEIVPFGEIAFGGYTSGCAIQAAFHSLGGDNREKDTWSIYSANGLYLGPTLLSALIEYEVQIIRNTRSFATRFITARQTINGKTRRTFCVLIDFTKKMPSSGPAHSESRLPLCYSTKPVNKYPHPDELKLCMDYVEYRTKQGFYTSKMQKTLDYVWKPFLSMVDVKMIEENVMSHTMGSVIPYSQTKKSTRQQEEIADVTNRRCADYFRVRGGKLELIPEESLPSGVLPMTMRSLQASLLALVADQMLAALPILEHRLAMQDSGGASTLDFSIRFHDDDYDFRQYHLREMRTYCAERQRAFGETLVFNLDGKLIASMTQQCACRAKSDFHPHL